MILKPGIFKIKKGHRTSINDSLLKKIKSLNYKLANWVAVSL